MDIKYKDGRRASVSPVVFINQFLMDWLMESKPEEFADYVEVENTMFRLNKNVYIYEYKGEHKIIIELVKHLTKKIPI